jgi:lipoic acid synthetase
MISLSGQILSNEPQDFHRRRKPDWLRARLPGGPGYERLRTIMDRHQLHTVCESAKCPNMGECWSRGTATIMILGDVCTRSCGFCHIATGRPSVLDGDEPRRVAEAVGLMHLRHIVITSVNRDELPDGGASLWAETIRRVREGTPQTSIEVLIPDFCGDWDALRVVLESRPDILNHNLETIPRLYSVVRPQAKYDRSVELLSRAKQQGFVTKTGIMVGIGETDEEVIWLMRDVVDRSRCDILTIGQYLQPTRDHLPISRWVTPDQFRRFKEVGESLGFKHVESGPLVRSSYHAEEQVLKLEDQAAG